MAGLRILIVEDEPLIAMMLEDFIDALGHATAAIADSVASALPLVEAGAFDCAILDIHLYGGERAWPIADALAGRGKRFVLASGGQTDALPDPHSNTPLLVKPYTLDGVREALANLAI